MTSRRLAAGLALASCLLGCRADGDPVNIITTEDSPNLCTLTYFVVDVYASPLFGTVDQGGSPLKWPSGFAARRAGAEVEVLAPDGTVVLKTGARYRLSPSSDGFMGPKGGGAVCGPSLCPDCELGESGPM